MNSPVKKEYITQEFGERPEFYGQYGLKGHNGIDYRAFKPDGTRAYRGGISEVFAPHDGKIIENRFDSGYGNYVKIENDVEGSVLAHFSDISPVGLNSEVKMGQFIGFQGSTGNSSGIHLHWGYYKKPRDRSNGYAGYINQKGLYNPYGSEVNMPTELEVCMADRQKFWDERDELYRLLEVENQAEAIAEIKSLQAAEAKWNSHECPEPPPVIGHDFGEETGTKAKYDKNGVLLEYEKTYQPVKES